MTRCLISNFVVLMATIVTAKAQVNNINTGLSGEYTFRDEFCSASFLFKNNGEFYYEGGCEAHSSIAKGKYDLNGNKVIMHADSAELTYNITVKKTPNKDSVILRIVDSDGEPLSYFSVFTLPRKTIRDTLRSMRTLSTNKNGELLFGTHSIAYVSFERHGNFIRDKSDKYIWVRVKKKNKKKSMTVQFNYPKFCLHYPRVGVAKKIGEVKRILPGDTLIDSQSNAYSKKGN